MDGSVATIERIGRKEPKVTHHAGGKKPQFVESVRDKKNKRPRSRAHLWGWN